MEARPLDELEKLILRHLASGPSSAADLTDALRASSQTHGLAITHAKITYRLGGLVSLKLVGSAERKLSGQRRDFLYSLRAAPSQAEPKATTEAAPPSVEPPKGTQELPPKEDAPPTQAPPKASKGASKSPSNPRQDGPPKLAPAPREVYPQGREDYLRQRRAALVRAGQIKGASRCTR